VNVKNIDSEEEKLLEYFVEGTSLSQLEKKGSVTPEAIATYLADWINRGWLKGISDT
jgi:hypothetical protein